MGDDIQQEINFLNWLRGFSNYFDIKEGLLILPGEDSYNLHDVLLQHVPEDYQKRVMEKHYPKIVNEAVEDFLHYVDFTGFIVNYEGKKKFLIQKDDFLRKIEILNFIYECQT